MFDLLYI